MIRGGRRRIRFEREDRTSPECLRMRMLMRPHARFGRVSDHTCATLTARD